MRKTTLLFLMMITLGFSQSIPPLPTFLTVTPSSLIGKWKLEKIELYNSDNTIEQVITSQKNISDFETILAILPYHEIKITKNTPLNEQGIANKHKWYIEKDRLLIKSSTKRIVLNIISCTSQKVLLE